MLRAWIAFKIITKVVSEFTINPAFIEKAMTPELYATYDAYRSVIAGVAFRDAYRETATKVKENKIDVAALKDDFLVIQKQVEKDAEEAAKDLEQLNVKN